MANDDAALILGLEPRVSVAVARSLWRRGVRCLLGVTETPGGPGRSALASRAIESTQVLPRDPQALLDRLLRLGVERGVRAVIPCGDHALDQICATYEGLIPHLDVGCPPPEIIERVLDKRRTLAAARRSGIPVPETIDLASPDALRAQLSLLRFPAVVKPAQPSRRSVGFKVRHLAERRDVERWIRADPEHAAGALVQEYCHGDGVGVGVLMHRGDPLAVFQHRRAAELPATGGVSVIAVSEMPSAKLRDAAVDLLRAIDWEGIAMVEFRHDRDTGDFVLMEVNGRHWGSLATALHAGIDFPWYQWQLSRGEHPTPPASYPAGLRVRWTAGLLRRAAEELDELPAAVVARDVVSEFGPGTRDALFTWRDPLPALLEVGLSLRKLLAPPLRRVLRSWFPAGLRAWRRDRWRLDPRAARVYLALALLRDLGLRRATRRRLPRTARTIRFVCEGNILRSPTAAALLRQRRGARGDESRHIDSFGMGAVDGRPADVRARMAALEHGVDLRGHHARRLGPEDVARADALLVMDALNEAKLLARFPAAHRKVFLLGAWAVEESAEIPDPVDGDLARVRRTTQRIARAVDALDADLED